MAKSYSQIEGFDYQQTFSPVAKQTIVRVFLSIVDAQGWYLLNLMLTMLFYMEILKENLT